MSQVTDIPRWKMLSDPVDEPVAVPRWKQLSDPVDNAPPQTDSGPDRVTIDSPGWQDSPPVSDSPLTPDMQARAEADPVYQELQRRKAGQSPAVDPYSSQGRINTLAAAEGLPTDGQPTPAGAYTPLSPDIQPRGLLGNIGASAGQTAIHAIPRVIRDELPMSLQHPRPVEDGAGKVIGEAIGGLIPSTERPGDLLAMTKLFGAAEKAVAPLVKRIEAAAGPRVAAIAEKSLAGAGSAAPFGAIHEAGSNFDEWETDPARKLGKVMLAAGSSAAAGGVGGAGMGAVGGRSTHTDAITEARAAESSRQYREDTGRAFDPSTGRVEDFQGSGTGREINVVDGLEPTGGNKQDAISSGSGNETPSPDVPLRDQNDLASGGAANADRSVALNGSNDVTQPTPPIGESLAPVPESPATIDAQMQAMREGKRPAVLVTEGAAMPDKGGFAKLKTEAGVFIYDPKQVKPTEIKAAVAEDRVGDILGMGIPRKPEPGTEAGVVVVRTPEGVEKQSVVTDEASLPEVTEAARKMAGPGDTVGLETAEGVVRGRLEPTVSREAQETQPNLMAGGVQQGQPLQQAGKPGEGAGDSGRASSPVGPSRKAKRGEYSKADVELRMMAWQEKSGYAREGTDLSEEHVDTASHDTLSTSFPGKLPGEVRDFVAGNPHLRKQFKANVPGGKAADVAASMGYDKYLARVAENAGSKTRSAIDAIERSTEHDPDAAWLGFLHDTFQVEKSQRKTFHVIDKPHTLPDGTTLEIGGTKFHIEHEDGQAILRSEDGAVTQWLGAHETIPVDAGTLKVPAKAAPKPKSETIGQGEGVFGQRVIDPATGTQQSMFGDTRPEPAKTGTDAVDAKIAAQYDPKQTPDMFGDDPEVSRARTDEPPGEEGGPETTGIAHRVSEAQGMEVERGVGIGPEASVERGRQLLKGGADPKKVIADFNKDGMVSHDRIAVVRAWEADLAKKSAAADEKYGHGSKQSDAAFKAWTDAKAAIKPLQTEWHRIGQAQQGETEIDTGTFHGMRAAHHEAGGKDFTPKQAEAAKKLSSEVKAKTEAAEAAKESIRDVAPEVELEPNARSLADRIIAKLDKASTESLDWLKKNYLSGTTLRSGLDPTALYHLSRYGAAKIAKGVVKFSAWSAEMVKDLGESIQPHLKAVWEAADKELDRLVMADQSHAEAVKSEKAKSPKAKAAKKDTPEKIASRVSSKSSVGHISNVARELSRAFIREGVVDREANVDAVHAELSKAIPEITREQTSDAMSGYGDFRPLSKDPVEVRRREISGEIQQVRKLQDMASGKAPKRSGVERQSPTDEARDLIRRVNEAKKAGGYVTTDPATQLRTALDARKTYVRNRITDLQKQIDDGVKAKKSNKPAPTDAALDALRERLKKVQEHYAKKFPEDKTPQQIQAIKDQIAELDKHLAAGTMPAKSPKPTTPKEIADLRAQRDALRAKVMGSDPAKREAIRQQIKVLEGHLKAGTKPVSKPTKAVAADIQALRDKRDALARQIRKPAPVDVSAHPPGTVMTPERVKALWKLAIPHVESGVTNFHALADILAKQTKLPTADIRSGLSAKGPAKAKLAELNDAEWALYKAKKNAKDWLRSQAPKTPIQKVLHYSGALRALETTGEFSVLGIQGASRLPISIGHAITHPFNPKMLKQDVRTFYRGLQSLSPRKAHEIDLAMQRDQIYQQMQRDGVRLYDEEHAPTGLEEIRTRSFLDRIWGVGSAIKGFDRFSRIVLNDIKMNQYKALADTLGRKPTKAEGKVIADIANLIGGTTNLGNAERVVGTANALLYSARLAAARARFLASPAEFAARGTNATRLAYAKTMANWMIGNAAIYGAFAMAGYEIGDDPRSNKFGKVKIGGAWVDLTGGLSSYVTFVIREVTNQTVTDKRGDLKDLGGPGPYDQSRLSVAATFVRGKLSPWASLFVDYMDNKTNVVGQPMDAEYFARKVTPLTWWDVAQAVREESPTDAAAISVLALFGKGVRNRPDDKKER